MTNDLKEHYNNLYNESINNIYSDKYEIDNLIDSNSDKRFGITLIIRPSNEVKENIQKFIEELKKLSRLNIIIRVLTFTLQLCL